MTDRTHSCPICREDAKAQVLRDLEITKEECIRCGKFKVPFPIHGQLKKLGIVDQAKLSGWVFDQNRDGTIPTISKAVLQQILTRQLPSFVERANRLLIEALRIQSRLGDRFRITEPRFLAATYSQDQEEVIFLVEMLIEKEFVEQIASWDGPHQVLPQGYIAGDELTRNIARSSKGFVAMWLDKNLEPAYKDGLQVGILNAGYDPVRVDQLEHTNRIDDEIIAQIKVSAFVVADFTGHRGGVYFEAGYALGLGLPVIWSCRKDSMRDLHFDIRQYNTIDWENIEELAVRLQHRIEASIGKGPKTILDY